MVGKKLSFENGSEEEKSREMRFFLRIKELEVKLNELEQENQNIKNNLTKYRNTLFSVGVLLTSYLIIFLILRVMGFFG